MRDAPEQDNLSPKSLYIRTYSIDPPAGGDQEGSRLLPHPLTQQFPFLHTQPLHY